MGGGTSAIAVATKKDFEEYKKSEQEVDLKGADNWTLSANGNTLSNVTLQANKDIVFKNGGSIMVQSNLYRNISGQVGGFVFKATPN